MSKDVIISSEGIKILKNEIVHELKKYIDREFEVKLKEYLEKRNKHELSFL